MMILAVTVLFAVGGVGPSLHWAEITADKCLYGKALRILDEVPTSEQRTRAAQMLRARLLACVRALRGDVAEAAALIRMSRHAGGGALPQDGDQRTDLPHLEEAVRRELGASELKRVRQRLREPARLTLWRDGCGLPGDGLNL